MLRHWMICIRHFNSQPHEEADDEQIKAFRLADNISTHSLTKRLTNTVVGIRSKKVISTHSLTKRLTMTTLDWLLTESISTHSLTKRLTRPGLSQEESDEYFNSQPHEEADERKYI